jgi:CRP-like cAMP-binding protein
MAHEEVLSREALERTRDVAVVVHLKCYFHMMMRELGLDDSDDEMVAAMAVRMVEPMNEAINAIWGVVVRDEKFKQDALESFRQSLEEM